MDTPTARAVIDAISLISSDLHRTAAFYRALGCDVPEPDDTGHLTVVLGGFSLMFDTEEVMLSFSPDTWSGSGAGRVSLAADCGSPAAVDAMYDGLLPLGGGSVVAPFDAPWGQRFATVRDPDGVRVDLYADRTS